VVEACFQRLAAVILVDQNPALVVALQSQTAHHPGEVQIPADLVFVVQARHPPGIVIAQDLQHHRQPVAVSQAPPDLGAHPLVEQLGHAVLG